MTQAAQELHIDPRREKSRRKPGGRQRSTLGIAEKQLTITRHQLSYSPETATRGDGHKARVLAALDEGQRG